MIKRFFILFGLILVSVYLIIAVTFLNDIPQNAVCQGVILAVKDSINYDFVTQKEIKRILQQKKLFPEKKQLNNINTQELENTLSQHPLIREVECYVTSGGKVAINIYQRIPLIRVMSNNGENYYIDNNGKFMSLPGKAAHVVVATGMIDRKFAQQELYPLAKFLQENHFWNAQIEQINITSKHEIELIPRVGDHVLFLGKPGNYDEKFTKLQTFYKKALNQVGWNKYKRISIEFNNQIIGTKKDK